MDITVIHETFVRNFIQKDRRDRCLLELKRGTFIDRLNHNWERVFDMRKFVLLPSKINAYSFIIQQDVFKPIQQVYVVSSFDDIDGKMCDFDTAFKNVYGRGFASIIISMSGDMVFVETEQVQGGTNCFVGKAILQQQV